MDLAYSELLQIETAVTTVVFWFWKLDKNYSEAVGLQLSNGGASKVKVYIGEE